MESQHTREMDKNRTNEKNREDAPRGSENMPGTMTGNRDAQNQGRDGASNEAGTLEQAKTMARNVGEQARSIANTATNTAQDLARRAREQTDTLYQQGTQAGEYLTRNVNEYPLTALLVAGAIGYGLGYLIHSGWTSESWNSWNDNDRGDRNGKRRWND
jgi:ElaB/YqjD/DUF883 family membrane-anchored ribosome-binding protein